MVKEKKIVDGKEVWVEVPDKPKEEGKPKDVSQEAINRVWFMYKTVEEKAEKDKKEFEEKLKASEENVVNLVGRVKKLEGGAPPASVSAGEKKYGFIDGKWNFPTTKEEWDDLHDEDPIIATDLRQQYNNMAAGQEDEM